MSLRVEGLVCSGDSNYDDDGCRCCRCCWLVLMMVIVANDGLL